MQTVFYVADSLDKGFPWLETMTASHWGVRGPLVWNFAFMTTLYTSAAEDGGKSWKRDRTTDDLAANLYEIKFVVPGTGFILGNDGGRPALPKPWQLSLHPSALLAWAAA